MCLDIVAAQRVHHFLCFCCLGISGAQVFKHTTGIIQPIIILLVPEHSNVRALIPVKAAVAMAPPTLGQLFFPMDFHTPNIRTNVEKQIRNINCSNEF